MNGRPRRRLAVARFWHEGNAFCPVPADRAAFERYEWQSGQAALDAARGTATELGALAEFASAHPDWEVVVLRCAAALPSGPVEDEVFETFLEELRAGLAETGTTEPWDAIYLSLHGASITAGRPTPDLDILRLVKKLLPDAPIGASFDLHGNLSPDIAELVDIASVYRTHPHVDMAQTALRVLAGLERCVEAGLRTRRALDNLGLLLPSFNMRTASGPMCELEALARAEEGGAILEVGVFGGFPYADTAVTSASVFVISDAALDVDGSRAAAAARRLADAMRERAPAFEPELPDAAEAIRQALAWPEPGLIAVTDPADNPLSGGSGDTPGLFAAVLAARPTVPTLFASFADAGVVDAAIAAGIGNAIDVVLGGRFGDHFGAGVAVRAVPEVITDGRFRNVGPMETGVERRCGGSVLLRIADQPSVRVIVSRQVSPCDDPAFFHLHGIAPEVVRLLCVKAKNHFRGAFASRCVAIIDCDAPGPAMADLNGLPFRHAPVNRTGTSEDRVEGQAAAARSTLKLRTSSRHEADGS